MADVNLIAATIRQSLLDAVPQKAKCAIALSGGVDSCAVLAAFLEKKRKPIIVSYTPDTHESTDYRMARETAANLNLPFVSAVVCMDPDVLDYNARRIIGMGWYSKVQVESLVPMISISEVAKASGATRLFTGDQSDGYFALSKWAAHNLDRSLGVPFGQRSRSVKEDTDSRRIDIIRQRYYDGDLSCSGAVADVCATVGLKAEFPFRDVAIYRSFLGSLWSEVNRPRIKEPVRRAFDYWFHPDKILVRPTQVNLHKGDSKFGETLSKTMMKLHPGYATPRGLYSAIHKGEI